MIPIHDDCLFGLKSLLNSTSLKLQEHSHTYMRVLHTYTQHND